MEGGSETMCRLQQLNERWLQLARAGKLGEAWAVSDEALAARANLDCSRWPRHQQFVWKGQCLRGKRVLVRCYHGLGDTLQFVRFVPEVRALGATVILWAQAPLIPLLGTLENGAQQILPLHDGAPDVDYDVDLELFEVLHALRVASPSVRAQVPYILPTATRKVSVDRPLKVGLVWMAGDWNGRRSLSCELLKPLQEIRGVEWLLFQRGPGLAQWTHDFASAPEITDMMDEARQMLRLDLLVSVDTCSAHLAGALGVRVWTLLPYESDWRWMDGGADTPWYPTMRLFRQRSTGDWESVIAEVAAGLRELSSSAGTA
jgi:hypothetical protein